MATRPPSPRTAPRPAPAPRAAAPRVLAAVGAGCGGERERVVPAAGTSGANALAALALLEPGDEVLLEQPVYEPILGALRLAGARVRRFERRFEDGWRPDPEDVR